MIQTNYINRKDLYILLSIFICNSIFTLCPILIIALLFPMPFFIIRVYRTLLRLRAYFNVYIKEIFLVFNKLSQDKCK